MKELNLEEIKEIQLDILNSVDSFCRQNNIQYSLSFGTLLGAVRHKGYIPWDDDIDIMMPRPDYDKFIEEFNKFNKHIKVRTRRTDATFPFNFAKVEDTRSNLLEATDISFDIGINIDIFPVDGIPSDVTVLKKHLSKIRLLKRVFDAKKVKVNFDKRSNLKNFLLILLKGLFKPISYVWILNEIDKKLLMYDYNTSDYIMIACDSDKTYQRFRKKDFENFIELDFEGEKYQVISQYDDFLKLIYGDYMKLPPKDKQETHHSFKAYWK